MRFIVTLSQLLISSYFIMIIYETWWASPMCLSWVIWRKLTAIYRERTAFVDILATRLWWFHTGTAMSWCLWCNHRLLPYPIMPCWSTKQSADLKQNFYANKIFKRNTKLQVCKSVYWNCIDLVREDRISIYKSVWYSYIYHHEHIFSVGKLIGKHFRHAGVSTDKSVAMKYAWSARGADYIC